MALCVYHETTTAVAVCPVCNQGICGSCLHYGRDGMCGMCVEMAGALTAHESPAEAPELAYSAVSVVPAGRCVQHPNLLARSACAHCHERFCPYCLDLYDHCAACRALPVCLRHESMVAEERCAACKTHYCAICLDGTPYCDRCRVQRSAAKTGPTGTGNLRPARSATGPLDERRKPAGTPPHLAAPTSERLTPSPQPKGEPARRTATGELKTPGKTATGDLKAKPAPPSKAVRQSSDVRPRAAVGPYAPGGRKPARPAWQKWAAGGGVAVIVVWRLFFGHPSLSAQETETALHNEMALVQHAAVEIEVHSGSYPSTLEALQAELHRENIDVAGLAIPLALVVNSDPTAPLAIAYRRVEDGFEVRALDADGRPFAVDGRDVILRSPSHDGE